ncbi:hypothetical protein Q8I65_17875 [Paenibacillus ottowii]|nr:hypothetical protein [Paenibacillus ottowii]
MLSRCNEKSDRPSDNLTNSSTDPAPGEMTSAPAKSKAFPAVSDPYDADQTATNGDVVNIHGKMYNLEKWKHIRRQVYTSLIAALQRLFVLTISVLVQTKSQEQILLAEKTRTCMVVVTGGTGFVAGWAIYELLKRGYRIRTTVRSKEKELLIRKMIQGIGIVTSPLSFYIADEGWNQAMAGVEYVLHIASPLPNVIRKNGTLNVVGQEHSPITD